MGRNKTISLCFCLLAFIVVFAHSVVPHEHHCHAVVENHIHHFQHCEGLNTYIMKSSPDQHHQTTVLCVPASAAFSQAPAPSLHTTPDRLFDLSDHFRRKSTPDIPHGALRGPPLSSDCFFRSAMPRTAPFPKSSQRLPLTIRQLQK